MAFALYPGVCGGSAEKCCILRSQIRAQVWKGLEAALSTGCFSLWVFSPLLFETLYLNKHTHTPQDQTDTNLGLERCILAALQKTWIWFLAPTLRRGPFIQSVVEGSTTHQTGLRELEYWLLVAPSQYLFGNKLFGGKIKELNSSYVLNVLNLYLSSYPPPTYSSQKYLDLSFHDLDYELFSLYAFEK